MTLTRRKVAAAGLLAILGLSGAFGQGNAGLLAHQLGAPAAGDLGGALGGAAVAPLPGAPAADAPSAPPAPDPALTPAPAPLAAGPAPPGPLAPPAEPWVPAPVAGLPLQVASGMVQRVDHGIAASLAAQAGSPYDALLTASGDASALGLGAGFDADLGAAVPGKAKGILAAAEALVAGTWDLRDDLQRPLLEALQAQGLHPQRAAAQARDVSPDGMERAILRLYGSMGVKVTVEQRAQLHEDIARLDPDLVAGLAILLAALADAQDIAAAAMARFAPDEYQLLWTCAEPSPELVAPCADPLRAGALAAGLDRAALDAAALGVLAAVEQAQPRFDAFQAGHLAAASIELGDGGEAGAERDAGDDKDIFADPARLIQVGGYGNDIYYGNMLGSDPEVETAWSDSQVQLLTLDFSGEDLYLARAGGTSPAPLVVRGTGVASLVPHQDVEYRLGSFVALTIDYSGNDAYNGGVGSQGAAYMGVGILLEFDGHDQYAAQTSSQGAASMGLGLLYDATGDDTYASLYRSQGYGSSAGLGLLFDQGGNDRYSGQLLMQGAGYLQGAGMLLDVAGNDQYRAVATGRTASQGASYSIGLGVLADGTGADTYTSSAVAQGAIYPAPAPYGTGLALFLDSSGFDTYATPDAGRGNAREWPGGTLGLGRDV